MHQLGHFPFDLHAQRALGDRCQQRLGLVQTTGAPFGLGHVVTRRQFVQQEARQRHGVAQTRAERFGAQFAHIRIGIMLRRQEEEADRDVIPKHRQTGLQRAPRGAPAGLVAIKAEDDLVAGAQELLDVIRRGGGAERGNGIGNALLRQADHVHVALDDNHLAFLTDGLACLPQPVELLPLRKQGSFRRVQVLGFAFADDPAAKPDEASPRIADRKHHPFAKAIVAPPVLGLDDEAGLHQRGVLVVRKHLGQTVPIRA